MPTIPYETRQLIIQQALKEIEFARTYKQGKVKNWKINEDLYYGRKPATEESRANVDLGQAGSFVHTILAKVDNPMTFKFVKRKLAQLQRVTQLNGLKAIDQNVDDWDMKDLVGKKQAIIYGRAIFSYYADSEVNYKSHLDNVDVYDFLIDPSAGGLDIERAMYLGDYGVVLTRKQIKEGMKSGIFLKTEAQSLLDGSGNADKMTTEVTNTINRTQAQHVWQTNKEISNPDKYKFWRWYTTYEGQRYYLLLQENGATAIRVVPIEEVFESGLYPYWTWAAFPDLTEFWTPSFLDYVRELFMAEAVSINQMLDNAEEINKPMRGIDTGAIENLGELKYRKNGYIKFRRGVDVSKAIQYFRPPSIDTPIVVFDKLEALHEKNSGVTAGAQGDAANGADAKATIYEGNEANAADRFGLLNKSYAYGYKRFAKLWEHGVREHLIKKVAIDILGPDGVDIVEVSRRDIFRKGDEFGVVVEASNAELALSERDKQMKYEFLKEIAAMPVAPGATPLQNPKKAYEMMAEIVGFEPDAIRQLQDTDNFGNAEIMAEADRDIEAILDGDEVKPNQAANTAYKQRFVDYMRNRQEDLTDEEFRKLSEYVLSIEEIVTRNMVKAGNDMLMKATMAGIMNPQPSQNGEVGGGQEEITNTPTGEQPLI